LGADVANSDRTTKRKIRHRITTHSQEKKKEIILFETDVLLECIHQQLFFFSKENREAKYLRKQLTRTKMNSYNNKSEPEVPQVTNMKEYVSFESSLPPHARSGALVQCKTIAIQHCRELQKPSRSMLLFISRRSLYR